MAEASSALYASQSGRMTAPSPRKAPATCQVPEIIDYDALIDASRSLPGIPNIIRRNYPANSH